MSEWMPLRGVRRARTGYSARFREHMLNDFPLGLVMSAIESIAAIPRLRASGAEFDRATSTLRAGRRSITATEIVSARIEPLLLESGVLIVRFGDPEGLEFNAYLRAGIDSISPQETRQVLADILHSSSIGTSRRGHTSRNTIDDSNESISMTRNEAIALVLDAPPIDADLPLTH